MSEDMQQLLEETWKDAIERKQFYEGLMIASAFYQVFRLTGDKELEAGAGILIGTSIELIFGPQVHPECSFCGRRPPNVKLIRGNKAHICDACVGDLAKHFAR